MTTKLSDTQLVVLTAACQRSDRNLLPLPANLKGGAAQKVVAGLGAKGFVQEVVAASGEPIWRTEEEGGRFTLRATDAAFQALGIEPDAGGAGQSGGKQKESGAKRAKDADNAAQSRAGGRKANGTCPQPGAAEAASVAASRTTRADSKQAQLIAMLEQPGGASLDEIIAATGWQPHTVRGAISGALKKKLGLDVVSEKVDGRGRVYRIQTGPGPHSVG